MEHYQRIAQRVRDARARVGHTSWLFGYDVNSIQALITACGRPIVMAGASRAISGFDGWVGEQYVEVFTGGGRGVCMARTEREAHEACQDLASEFQERTVYAALATAAVPFRQSSEASCIRWLRQQLHQAKDDAWTPRPALPSNREQLCEYCRQYAGTRRLVHRDDDTGETEREEYICKRCKTLLGEGQQEKALRNSVANIRTDSRPLADHHIRVQAPRS